MDILLPMPGVTGCETGCQVNDIRERPHWETTAGGLKQFRIEERIPIKWEYALIWIKAPHDAQGNTDCYWRGIYFFTDTNFTSALNRTQKAPTWQDYYDGNFMCSNQ